MNDIKVTAAARSDVGRVRTNNEEAFAIADLRTGTSLEEAAAAGAFDLSEMGVLLAVSDGMGGHQAGEVASSMVLDSLRRAMVVQQPGPRTWETPGPIFVETRSCASSRATRVWSRCSSTAA